MSSVRVLKVLSDEQRTRIVDILTNAFWDHTLIVNVLGGDLSLIRPCMEASVRIVEESGQIHVAGQTSAKIDAVALWYPPGHDFVPTEKSGWFDVAAKVAPDVAAWWGPLFGAQITYIDSLLGESAHRHGWHLFYIGVEPALQRRGLGSQLIQYVLPQAKEASVNIIVEASHQTAPFYKKNGLANRGHVHVQSPRGAEWDQVMMVWSPE